MKAFITTIIEVEGNCAKVTIKTESDRKCIVRVAYKAPRDECYLFETEDEARIYALHVAAKGYVVKSKSDVEEELTDAVNLHGNTRTPDLDLEKLLLESLATTPVSYFENFKTGDELMNSVPLTAEEVREKKSELNS